MAYVRLVINSNGTADDFKSQCPLAVGGLIAIDNFSAYMAQMAGGAQMGGSLSFHVGALQASGTVTFSSTGPTNGQTMTIAGVTMTAVTSGATGNQFNISSTPATVAANLITAITASTSLQNIVTATALLGVVTIKAYTPGKMGNGLVMANVNLANTVVVTLAAGSDGTAYLNTSAR